jgi:hypothetical protein
MRAELTVASASDTNFTALTISQSMNSTHEGLIQLLNLFEASGHQQAHDTGATHDQFLQEAHMANLIAGQFHFH